jgi:hypothetical protein
MSTTLDDRTAGDETRWRAWVQRGRRRDRAAAVKYKWVDAKCAGPLTLAAIYFGAIR